jgi:hypothetical protein
VTEHQTRVTALLRQGSDGDANARDRLVSIVYQELRGADKRGADVVLVPVDHALGIRCLEGDAKT